MTYSSSPPSSAPAPAAAVGYTNLTFNSNVVGTSIGQLQAFNFFSTSQPAGSIVQNGTTSVTFTGHTGDSGGNPYGATAGTASYNASKPQFWQGIAFGGGFYYQATFSYTGTQAGDAMGVQMYTITTMSGYISNHVQGNMNIEIDGPEFNVPGSTTQYGLSCHNYYWNSGAQGTANPANLVAASPITIPSGGTGNLNTYGLLWVPATVSTQGYLQWYFNGAQVGPTVLWNQYSGGQGFPPTGSNICNVLDTLRMNPVFGTSNTSTPMTVTSVQVWQGSGANNAQF